MKKTITRGSAAIAARRQTDSAIDQAAKLTAKFHGRGARKITDSVDSIAFRETFSALGALTSLRVESARGIVDLGFGKSAPRVMCSPDGLQLYFLDGDQRISLDAVGLPREAARDMVTIGTLKRIVYLTRKGFHDFEPIDYKHDFGTTSGRADLIRSWQRALARSSFRFPSLVYDGLNERLLVTGGAYVVRREGIVF